MNESRNGLLSATCGTNPSFDGRGLNAPRFYRVGSTTRLTKGLVTKKSYGKRKNKTCCSYIHIFVISYIVYGARVIGLPRLHVQSNINEVSFRFRENKRKGQGKVKKEGVPSDDSVYITRRKLNTVKKKGVYCIVLSHKIFVGVSTTVLYK